MQIIQKNQVIPMKIEQIQYVLAIYETGSISKAAERFYLSRNRLISCIFANSGSKFRNISNADHLKNYGKIACFKMSVCYKFFYSTNENTKPV